MTQPIKKYPTTSIDWQIMPGPDGKPWVAMSIEQGLTKALFLIYRENIEIWAAQMPKVMRDLVLLLKRAESGLVVANEQNLKNINGKKDGKGI